MTPEFARPYPLDRIGERESNVTVTADEAERAALAARFGLARIDSLEAVHALRRDGAGVRAKGHLTASVVQNCVVTGDPVPAAIDEEFELRFVPEASSGPDEEVELSEAECDTVFFAGNSIDLGEAAAETLALALDPYPRSSGAAQALSDAGVVGEEEVGPFGALASLRDKLSGD